MNQIKIQDINISLDSNQEFYNLLESFLKAEQEIIKLSKINEKFFIENIRMYLLYLELLEIVRLMALWLNRFFMKVHFVNISKDYDKSDSCYAFSAKVILLAILANVFVFDKKIYTYIQNVENLYDIRDINILIDENKSFFLKNINHLAFDKISRYEYVNAIISINGLIDLDEALLEMNLDYDEESLKEKRIVTINVIIDSFNDHKHRVRYHKFKCNCLDILHQYVFSRLWPNGYKLDII